MARADIEVKRNDRRPYLDSTLTDANGAVDLSGATVKFFMVDADDNTVIDQTSTGSLVTIQSATAGTVRYQWAAADTSTGGRFRAEWQVTFGDGTQATFPNTEYLTVRILADLDST